MRRDDYLEIESPSNNLRNAIDEEGWTNDVLIHDKENQTEIFMPCYLRTKLKNFVSLDSSVGKGTINLVIILSVYYGSIERLIPDFLNEIRENIVLRFKIDPPMKLTEGFTEFTDIEGNKRSTYITIKNDEQERLLTYSIRRTLVVPLISHIFWSPFELIKYVSTITIESIYFEEDENQFKIYFNQMDISDEFDKYSVVSYTEEGALGEYDLAKSLVEAEFTNKRYYSGDLQEQLNNSRHKMHSKLKEAKDFSYENEKLKPSKIKIEPFQFSHSVYPVYRRPLVPLVNIFFPIMILGFINLGIFFQDNLDSGKKITNIGALLISYIAFLPTIRTKIPPSKSLVISELMLFAMASLTILTLFHTIKVRDEMEYEFKWNKEKLYLSTLIITLVLIGILCAISLIFALIFRPKFKRHEKKIERKFDMIDWVNKSCDLYFNNLREMGLDIKPITKFDKPLKKKRTIKKTEGIKQKKSWFKF